MIAYCKRFTEVLNSADFGVVVLSKAFFRKKKWAENELAGLFALETTTRKIILPVWKDLTETDVKKYSPILAERFAVLASQGISKVVDEIKIAVNVAQRKDEIARDINSRKVRALVNKLTERKEAERLAFSEEGVQLVFTGLTALFDQIERTIKEGAATSSVIKFRFRRPMRHIFYVNTVYGMHLGIGLRNFAINSVTNAQLEARIFRKELGAFGDSDGSGKVFEQLMFKPSFRAREVIWIAEDRERRAFVTSDLTEHLIDRFIELVNAQAESS